MMKYFIVGLFTLSLLSVCFLVLNYLWDWVDINYSIVGKTVLTILVILLSVTGLAMILKGGFARNPRQPNVGKK